MTTTREVQGSTVGPVLHVAFELGLAQWKLACTTGLGQAPRMKNVAAGDLDGVLREIAKAKERFGLASDASVVSCYEAGRDGFWLHRWLTSVGVANRIIDSSSIQVDRKKRRVKTDVLDAQALVTLLVRYGLGETKAFRVVHVPSEEAEDARHLHRELSALKEEQTSLVNQLKGHLCGQGVKLGAVNDGFADWLTWVCRWDGSPVPAELQGRLRRIHARWRMVHAQILELEAEQRRRIRADATPQVDKIRLLLGLKGIGASGAWTLVKELFGWREGFNRKQLGALVGLTPTPYASGKQSREQGISKSGNKNLRRLLVELAWCWVRYQPGSELTQWFYRRFNEGSRRRRIGITAVARKLLIALWRLLRDGEIPKGAKFVGWETKLRVAKRPSASEKASTEGASERLPA